MGDFLFQHITYSNPFFPFFKKRVFHLSSVSQYVINVSGKSATISLHLII